MNRRKVQNIATPCTDETATARTHNLAERGTNPIDLLTDVYSRVGGEERASFDTPLPDAEIDTPLPQVRPQCPDKAARSGSGSIPAPAFLLRHLSPRHGTSLQYYKRKKYSIVRCEIELPADRECVMVVLSSLPVPSDRRLNHSSLKNLRKRARELSSWSLSGATVASWCRPPACAPLRLREVPRSGSEQGPGSRRAHHAT
jgi:hypothetical protein